jgi:hypothetical protein
MAVAIEQLRLIRAASRAGELTNRLLWVPL